MEMKFLYDLRWQQEQTTRQAARDHPGTKKKTPAQEAAFVTATGNGPRLNSLHM